MDSMKIYKRSCILLIKLFLVRLFHNIMSYNDCIWCEYKNQGQSKHLASKPPHGMSGTLKKRSRKFEIFEYFLFRCNGILY